MAGVKIIGMEGLKLALQRTGDRTHQRMLRAVRRAGKRIAETAREYAPIDEGNLEDAITDGFEERSERNRLIIGVGVDEKKLGPGYSRRGFNYHIEMHENYPYAIGQIPDKPHLARSYRKQMAGKQVGGKYLERAFEYHRKALEREVEQIAREVNLT